MIKNYKEFLKIPPDLANELKYEMHLYQCTALQIPFKNGAFNFGEVFLSKFCQSLQILKKVILKNFI